jgi:hypothetical protein
LQLPGGIELVIARKDDARDLLLVITPGDQITPDDLQPAIPLPDFIPEVACAVTGGVRRVALRSVVALVKW